MNGVYTREAGVAKVVHADEADRREAGMAMGLTLSEADGGEAGMAEVVHADEDLAAITVDASLGFG